MSLKCKAKSGQIRIHMAGLMAGLAEAHTIDPEQLGVSFVYLAARYKPSSREIAFMHMMAAI